MNRIDIAEWLPDAMGSAEALAPCGLSAVKNILGGISIRGVARGGTPIAAGTNVPLLISG